MLLLKGHHPRPHGGGRDALREIVHLDDVGQFLLGRVSDGGAAVRNHLCFCDHGLLLSFIEDAFQVGGQLGKELDPAAHEGGILEIALPLFRGFVVKHVEEVDDVPAGIGDVVIGFDLLVRQVILWLVSECTFPGVLAYGHATFFGPPLHQVVFLLGDPGVQVQGAPGGVFCLWFLFLHNLLPFNSMRACEHSRIHCGQTAARNCPTLVFLA